METVRGIFVVKVLKFVVAISDLVTDVLLLWMMVADTSQGRYALFNVVPIFAEF